MRCTKTNRKQTEEEENEDDQPKSIWDGKSMTILMVLTAPKTRNIFT